ncbi:aminomethyl-transferring glycine dehydrogenase subunit GcvPA [Paenibacillus alvei]|uniref:aminomethyl-transferring glycine dehydrogenase subunit GcvPA n=1 Tax=Paenibacillus alvei TaxID=44250 RepID=UPI0018CE2915|nr:aminomethyl-transferring glycine dehydrogenase subunit GcvPA [Paenibacillus alvei]MBG9735535.1 glycine dehydrogenase [Paenibacillus alvei]MBG9746734.1 glycine dehydrogenase [Paenibacillus alvei]MCY9578516.1 aminomethyl-transferring glycine dehydrogenase subunit GcvPA [Paenibacillus alvei]MCY9584837.1 aminomethyl-transferring glycine dehydrogenase subunit GcvPA [Paenibacillus alvei]
MKHRYIPMTEQDQADMLQQIGISSMEDLFRDIPASIRYNGVLPMSEPLDEVAMMKHMKQLASRNADNESHTSFLGAGIYDHHIPVVIQHLVSRSEFYTAYTPYQPEISQGELQAIFEFQSYICELTGMAVANASMYDGATAMAEAGALAVGATKRKQLVISSTVHPEARQIVRTMARGLNVEVVEIGYKDGVTDLAQLEHAVTNETAAVLIQSPNFFGCIEDIRAIEPIAHAHKGLLVMSTNPLSLALLESPGKLGVDVCVGDAQPLGIAPSFGGPTCGFFAVAEPYMRRIPGRIVGLTKDLDGKRGFVLTLQAREQHIRREKATSNICSNQALLALAASIYMSVMGKKGMQEVAKLNIQKSHYASAQINSKQQLSLAFQAPYFNEFVVRLPEGTDMDRLHGLLLDKGYIGGLDLGRFYPELAGHMLIAVTEKKSKSDIEQFIDLLEVSCV